MPKISHKTMRGLTQNWINAINFGEKLISPGEEGINSLNISNTIYLSSWLDKRIGIPARRRLVLQRT